MTAKRWPKKSAKKTGDRDDGAPAGVRIIGGRLRGRKIEYSGLLRTRPMKDRVRESLFNLLGYEVEGKCAIDLFAGTGALGLEAISRGAAQAILIEQHLPTCDGLRRTVQALGIDEQVQVVAADTFRWAKRKPALPDIAWLVFCSPPYELYDSNCEAMLSLLGRFISAGPPGSVFVVESDERFSFTLLPHPESWSVREYPPARLGILEKTVVGGRWPKNGDW